MTTVTDTVAAPGLAGMGEMYRAFPTTVKQPGAEAPGHGSRTTGVPAFCSAVVPISMAVARVALVPPTSTPPPPATLPLEGTTRMPDGPAGRAVVAEVVSVAGLASAEVAVAGALLWTSAEVTFAEVTMATTVITGRAVPLVKLEPLVVQVIDSPTGFAHTQPVP